MSLPQATKPLIAAIGLALAPLAQAGVVSAPGAPEPAQLDRVEVKGSRYLPSYQVRDTRIGTKTDTPLVDVPQSASVVTQELMRDQDMHGMQEVLRYVPGAGVAQGEGNRDTSVLRGTSSTADFFVDGVRDDVQYIRDLYNIERVEVLKGPNAMIFGRGGSGGVINRVTKHADGSTAGEVTLQYGTWNRKRGSVDWQMPMGADAAFRINAVLENSDSFREGFWLKRKGINPTARFNIGDAGVLNLSFEHFQDERVADRGVTSWEGRPVDITRETFFGDPSRSPVKARANAFDADFGHRFSDSAEVRNRFRVADYDKFYQNVFGSGTQRNAAGDLMVALNAYGASTQRRNWFNQTDFVFKLGNSNVRHTLLAGLELGKQDTTNQRLNIAFPNGSLVPLSNPRFDGALAISYATPNQSTAKTIGVYVQDQIEIGEHWQAIVGVRHDRFEANLRSAGAATLQSTDAMWSPRAGLIYKPRQDMSVYASYSVAFQPRAGEQLASLSASTASLTPEKFINREVGFKWDAREDLSFTAALYQLDRRNVAITDPADVTRMMLVDGQRAKGVELGVSGRLTDRWQIMGGYAWQDGELLSTASSTAKAGSRLAQLPKHTASLWNRFDVTSTFGLGLGAIYRDAFYPSTDNTVTVPGFVRWDAAAYWNPTNALQLQVNIENLFDRHYYASAHSNHNISPGAPRGATLTARFKF